MVRNTTRMFRNGHEEQEQNKIIYLMISTKNKGALWGDMVQADSLGSAKNQLQKTCIGLIAGGSEGRVIFGLV